MDAGSFDGFSRRVGAVRSRRNALGAVLGTVLGGLLGPGPTLVQHELAAAKQGKKRCKGRKRPGQKCQTKRGKCKCSGGATCQGKRCECPGGGQACGATCCPAGQTCVNGTCEGPPGGTDCDVCPSGCEYDNVQDAVNDTEAGETITICAGDYPGPITIDKDLTLAGAGAVDTALNGHSNPSQSPVLTIQTGATVTVHELAILNGVVNQGDQPAGGGISNAGTLTLVGVTVRGNASTDLGGGIYTTDSLTLLDCRVTNNSANAAGGGIFNDSGTVSLESGSSVSENRAFGGSGSGGGIWTESGSTTTIAADSSVTDNHVGGNCGGPGTVDGDCT